jgi:peptidyl-prolyl cis-trans isomerase B (cyclophilin B)
MDAGRIKDAKKIMPKPPIRGRIRHVNYHLGMKFMITLHTNVGDIQIELDFTNTPVTAENFLKYARENFYKDTIFHRVIDGFMIQGGGFVAGMESKEKNDTIMNEADKAKPNKRGTLAMARTSDPHSASSQFFINVADNDFLNYKSNKDWGYCVFGHVVNGMDVVDKIRKVKTTTRRGHQDVPVEDVVIENVSVEG